MGLPVINPIDQGWLSGGTPIDHLGTDLKHCEICLIESEIDSYQIILGKYGGFGTPFFISPFLKRKSTTGKIGHKGRYQMCRNCKSLLAMDEGARNALTSNGLPARGLIKEAFLIDLESRSATKMEQQIIAPTSTNAPTRAVKITEPISENSEPMQVDVVNALERLNNLYMAGSLSESEFATAKTKLLGQGE